VYAGAAARDCSAREALYAIVAASRTCA